MTILDGDAFLLRGRDRLALAEGVVLEADDILDIPAGSRLARLEYSDGTTLSLGPGSRVLIAPRLPGDRAGARIYLLSGWAKLGVPQGVQAGISARGFDTRVTSGMGGTVVMVVQAGGTTLFVETGEANAARGGAAPQGLKAGELMTLAAADDARPELTNRPTQAFVATMPRAFMDNLPLRAARFQGKPVAPRALGPFAYADAQPWIDAEPALRRAYLPRWRSLAREPEARRELLAAMKSHPEWAPVLDPSPSQKKTTR